MDKLPIDVDGPEAVSVWNIKRECRDDSDVVLDFVVDFALFDVVLVLVFGLLMENCAPNYPLGNMLFT